MEMLIDFRRPSQYLQAKVTFVVLSAQLSVTEVYVVYYSVRQRKKILMQ